MKVFSAECTINAPAEKIWGILIDGANYPQWDPGMQRVEGTFAPGEKINFYIKQNPDRPLAATIAEFDPGKKMVLKSGMPLGLFKSERTHSLIPEGNSIKFSTREEFSGLMLGLIGGRLPDLNKVFTQFAGGLKEYAEAGEEVVEETAVTELPTAGDEEE